jgi:uncharacterized protein VirK/YbjX
MFLEFLTPIDFVNYFEMAYELEQKKLDDIEKNKRQGYENKGL